MELSTIGRRAFLASPATLAAGGIATACHRAEARNSSRATQSNNHVHFHYDQSKPYDYRGAMQGSPPPPDARVTTVNYLSRPEFLRWAMRHMNELVATQTISRGHAPVAALEARPDPKIDTLVISDTEDNDITVAQFLTATDCDGFLVIAKFSSLFPRNPQMSAKKDALQRIGMKQIAEKVASEC